MERKIRQMKSCPLKVAREARGWSQAKLAESLGVALSTVSRWERRIILPHPYYREQLSTLFGKTIEELGLVSNLDENDAVQEECWGSDPDENDAVQEERRGSDPY